MSQWHSRIKGPSLPSDWHKHLSVWHRLYCEGARLRWIPVLGPWFARWAAKRYATQIVAYAIRGFAEE